MSGFGMWFVSSTKRLMAVKVLYRRPGLRRIGKMSYGKTVQNLWLAFMFNGVGVPLATTGLVHPSLAMATSVSLVLANSFGGNVFGFGHKRVVAAVRPR